MSEPAPSASQSGLALLGIPFVFSQVGALATENFRKAASDWGFQVSTSDLAELRSDGLLVPLFADVDAEDSQHRITIHQSDQSAIARYARDGVLRSPDVPSAASQDAEFFYSQWQLLGLRDALREKDNRRLLPIAADPVNDFAQRTRVEHIALAALSTRFFPQIIGQISIPSDASEQQLRRSRLEVDAQSRLEIAELPAERLVEVAKWLLLRAHTHDPLAQWWDLVRHSDHKGWFKLRGRALESVWQRIAAEVFLLAHEEFAEAGLLAMLPGSDPAAMFYSPLTDRIGAKAGVDSLPTALTRLSLSPQPRVVLVLEGDVEMFHMNAALDEVGLGRGHRVRLVKQGTSSARPVELARFVAPQLGRTRSGRATVEGAPTALMVAMDNEGDFLETNGALSRTTENLRMHVRESVSAQGGVLSEDDLDTLVDVRTWGPQKYELANFDDEELATAMARVAVSCGDSSEDPIGLAARLLAHLQYARSRSLDVKVVYDRVGWPVRKMDLARELLPGLLSQIGTTTDFEDLPPLLKLAADVEEIVQRLSLGTFSLAVAESESNAQPKPGDA